MSEYAAVLVGQDFFIILIFFIEATSLYDDTKCDVYFPTTVLFLNKWLFFFGSNFGTLKVEDVPPLSEFLKRT